MPSRSIGSGDSKARVNHGYFEFESKGKVQWFIPFIDNVSSKASREILSIRFGRR